MDVADLEVQLRKRLDTLGPAPRAELLHVLMLPDFARADRIGEFWSYQQSPPSRFAGDPVVIGVEITIGQIDRPTHMRTTVAIADLGIGCGPGASHPV